MSTRTVFPELTEQLNLPPELVSYLNELTRALYTFDANIFANNLLFESSRTKPNKTVTSVYQMGINDSVILADTSAGAFTVTLPTALNANRVSFYLKRVDNSVNDLTVGTPGVELIDGSATLTLFGYETIHLYSNGSHYYIL